jgi:hypothetical protein
LINGKRGRTDFAYLFGSTPVVLRVGSGRIAVSQKKGVRYIWLSRKIDPTPFPQLDQEVSNHHAFGTMTEMAEPEWDGNIIWSGSETADGMMPILPATLKAPSQPVRERLVCLSRSCD